MNRKAVYPGTFDPMTRGHLNIIERASAMYDEVIVLIMYNGVKKCTFTELERKEMIERETTHLNNVKVHIGQGLTVHTASALGAEVMIRGIRATSDYEYELQIATANMMLDPKGETVFLMSRPEYSFVSSTTVKEIAMFHGELSNFVTPYVRQCLMQKYQ